MQQKVFKRLDALKSKLDEYRPLDAHVVKNLHENMVLQWTYHSNAIEGNTLTPRRANAAPFQIPYH